MAHDEDLILERLRELASRAVAAGSCEIGIGDDAAVGAPPPGENWKLLAGVDCAIDGVHFVLDECGPLLAAGKAVRASISDIAAMGGGERGFVLASVTFDLGRSPAEREVLLRGVLEAASACGFELAGGDITAAHHAPTTLSITACAWSRDPILRSGARAGDLLAVTGALGGSIAGRHLEAEPRLAAVAALRRSLRPSAMIDVSDGLAPDAARLLAASGVGAVIDLGAIPLAPDAGGDVMRALGDGEDHELLFCFPASLRTQLPRAVAGVPVTVIGDVTELAGLRLRGDDGVEDEAPAGLGWDHLRERDDS